jgi:hypothetical protein
LYDRADCPVLEHALASRRLYTDGAEVLYDYARLAGDTPEGESARELVVVRNGQRVFAEIVDHGQPVLHGASADLRHGDLPQLHWHLTSPGRRRLTR